MFSAPPLSSISPAHPFNLEIKVRAAKESNTKQRDAESPTMINVAGVVSIVLFYLLILGVGIWAGRKKEHGNDSEEEVMLAGRSIGLFVGIFTMTGD